MDEIILRNGFKIPYISSRSNPKTVFLSKLANKKYRDESESFLCEGEKLFLEAKEYGEIASVVLKSSYIDLMPDIIYSALSELLQTSAEIIAFSDSAFDKISSEKSPQGIICRVNYSKNCRKIEFPQNTSEYLKDKKVLILDSVRDPGNIGTVLRSAAAFGIQTVLLYSCADIYNGKALRAAMGAHFKVELLITEDLTSSVKSITKSGRRVLAASLGNGALVLGKYEMRHDDCVIIGNEGHGISEDTAKACSNLVKIPMTAGTESLNASAAAAVILWEYARLESLT